ncbi:MULTISPECIES: hypothetical protein [Bizionia]|uniref:Uncharacterized protein n=1 Tax=Bizionia algoritergicola TaxID=291187 RepID=A0A5D0QMJ0_9FLAO|nr:MULTISPECIES: hypothetical protein [Bizionia]OBX17508.1 hypothetical protein BAA08_16230 [Bizionia sp. APA-3]TYB69404.1 hypothetical protein ES675_16235 [Bizionia algoritergicola]
MKAAEILDIKNLIKRNIVKGDYITLGKMLDCEHSTARMRFNRDNEEAVLAMKEIVDNRSQLIQKYKSVQTINGIPVGFAILDCGVAKSGRLLMLLITNHKSHEIVYDNASDMDSKCHEFIERILKQDKVASIITDCSIGYIPNVIKVIKSLKITQYHQHKFASRSESIMQLLLKRY